MVAPLASPPMQALGSLVLVAAALLAIAGVAKTLRPQAASIALHAVRLPSSTTLVRLLGLGEVALAVTVAFTAHRALLAAMGAVYLSFAAFVVVSVRAGERASCGCFGEAATPPGPIHVIADGAIAAVALVAAVVAVPPLPDLLGGGAVRTMLVLGGVGLASYLMVALLTTLPQAMGAVTELSGGRR